MTAAAPSKPPHSPDSPPSPAGDGGAADGPLSTSAAPLLRSKPPEWAVERLIKWIGRIPAAIGRGLDGMARWAVIGPAVRLFSSVVFGLVVLGLIGLYIAIGSGFAGLRARLEMTDLQFFDAWPMRILLALLVLDLTTVTLRRIPLTLFKLGPWIVHTGILTLIAGSVWYFSCKQEGSARIYLGQSINACYDVTERALYAFRETPSSFAPDSTQPTSGGTFDFAHAAMTPLPSLPIFFEHLADSGNPLNQELPAALASLDPRLKNVKVTITGYYPSAELQPIGWREATPADTANAAGLGPAVVFSLESSIGTMPDEWLIAKVPALRVIEDENLPFGVEYLDHPTPERLRDLAASFDGPMGITVRIPKLKIERTYTAKEGVPIVVEGSGYTLTPENVLTMPMRSKGYERAMSSALTIKVVRKNPPGASAAPAAPSNSPATGDATFEYERMAVFRFPERTPDFITEDGKQVRKQDGVDPDIQIIFHDAARPQFWLVEDDAGKLTLMGRSAAGKAFSEALDAQGTAPLEVKGFAPMRLRVVRRVADAVERVGPVIKPPEQRKLGQSAADAILESMVELRLEGQRVPGSSNPGDWMLEHVYVPFVQFAQTSRSKDDQDPGRDPTVVNIPGVGPVGFLLSTTRRPLPSTVSLKAFQAEKYPGAANTYLDYYSTLDFTDNATGQTTEQVIHLNNPADDHGYAYFQAAWDGHDGSPAERRFSVVGVGNHPGVWGMIIGAAMIVVGIGYAFYAKPVLMKKKKTALAAWAQRAAAQGGRINA